MAISMRFHAFGVVVVQVQAELIPSDPIQIVFQGWVQSVEQLKALAALLATRVLASVGVVLVMA